MTLTTHRLSGVCTCRPKMPPSHSARTSCIWRRTIAWGFVFSLISYIQAQIYNIFLISGRTSDLISYKYGSSCWYEYGTWLPKSLWLTTKKWAGFALKVAHLRVVNGPLTVWKWMSMICLMYSHAKRMKYLDWKEKHIKWLRFSACFWFAGWCKAPWRLRRRKKRMSKNCEH